MLRFPMLSRQILRRSVTKSPSRFTPSLSSISCCRPITYPITTTSTSFSFKSFHTTSVAAMTHTPTAPHENVQMKVKAIYLPNLDILSFMSSAYPSHPRHIDKTCTVIALETTPAERTHHLSSDVKLGSLTPKQQKEQAITSSTLGTNLEVFNALSPYIILFEYGSIVFFNATEEQQSYALQKLTSLGYPASSSKDDYNIVLQPNLDRVCQLVPDKALLQSLDFNSLRVISQILAQTVAMDYYEQKVGPLMTDFRTLNEKLKDSGDLQDKKEIKHKLFKLIASNNLIMTDVLTQLKVLDRSDIAWRYGVYDSLWSELRKEFDLKDRFDALELKLDIISNNTLFFLEALHNKKSSRLEWIIIILIAAEIFLNLYEKVENYVEKLTGDQLVEALVPQIRITTPHQDPIPVHITAPPHITDHTYTPRTSTSAKTPINTATATPTATTTSGNTQTSASPVAPLSTPSIPTPTSTPTTSSTPDEDAEIAAMKSALAQLTALSRESSSDTPATSPSTPSS